MPDDSNKIPTNPTHAWMRLIMWFLPTGFAWMSVWATFWLERAVSYNSPPQLVLCILIIPNCMFTVGAGWFHTVLSPDGLKNGKLRINRVVEFFLIQSLLVICLPIVAFLITEYLLHILL